MKYKLKDLAVIKRGASPRPINEFVSEKGYPWLKISDFSLNDKFVYKTKEFIIEAGLKKTRYVKSGTLIVTNSATPGIPIFLMKDMCLHDGFLYFESISPKIDKEYLYYFILNNRSKLIKLGNGSVFVNLKKEILEKYEIELPSIDVQHKVARYLSVIDEKIKLNNEINDNLCEQIKATYKRIIDGSNNLKVTRIGDLPIYVTDYVANGSFASLKENVTLYQEPNYAYFIRNTDLKSGNFDVYVDEHSYNFLSKSTLKGKEIIISNVGDVGSVFLCPKLNKPMTLGNNVIMIEPEDEKLRYYLYSLFKWFDGYNLIQGIKGGSAVPKFNKTDFKNIKINLPLEKELEEFNNFVSPYFEKIIQNQDANKRLSELRDSLLPKLMSGEIDVDSIEL